MKTYYHAASERNLVSILENGIIPGPDGCVYMCETAYDAAKFLAVRLEYPIIVFSFKIYKREEHLVAESFDHSESFFKCRAFKFFGTIDPSRFGKIQKFERKSN